ncbi:ketol-acid reductoisomerase [Rhodovulum sulfidophilum]|uniref:Ketol-acid reductoisomerase n=1 Tax=Rhodovulum sulfidophilum TaxID=35806 RepID=A0ABS1RXR7_RHOSU|nr:ketol-acid reductoisomerase [Rhodovulum sulfidophilum]MBL3610297.1 ketol-acid reductoisomerase [Rhodovulum sulfidophilum]MCE8457929.1 ketol-acid reductoisomerase [Rhodovulum sulfidophilum]
MAQWYFDEDGDLSVLAGKTVGVFGYGNQGRSQALNMRDAGIDVIVGSRSDASAEKSQEDGFETLPLAEAARKADILFVLVPDEVMPAVYAEHIAPNLVPGNVVNFASGYNVHFKKIVPQDDVDVIMLAPRMVGQGVRDTVVAGVGFPSLVAVHQDATGHAWSTLIALAKAIGSTRMGVIESSFEEETVADLFNEHFGFLHAVRQGVEVLVEKGVSYEAAILELYASGEMREIGQYFVDHGLFDQLKLHSRTSAFGQLAWARPSPEAEQASKDHLRNVIDRIKDGTFASKWQEVQEGGMKEFEAAEAELQQQPFWQEELKLYKRLGRI